MSAAPGDALFDRLDDEERALLVEEDVPDWRAPMLATLADGPFDDPAWIFEPKLDGVRVIGIRDGSSVRLLSRNHKPMDNAYPEVVEALAAIDRRRFVVDGEIVAFSGDRPSFERLQRRMHVADPRKARATGVAVYAYLFDLLHVDGYDTTALPLRARKSLLEDAIVFSDPLRFSTHRNERGVELFHGSCERGWEGLIGKRADSLYKPGLRTTSWLKFKCVRRQEFVIAGFTAPSGSRQGFGALLVGYHDDDGALRYAGKVGTGFGDELLSTLHQQLAELVVDESPFADQVRERSATFVRPELVGEVGFGEWTDEGRLRHPRFMGLREDKDPRDVVREEPRVSPRS